jgi:hypothetical protein
MRFGPCAASRHAQGSRLIAQTKRPARIRNSIAGRLVEVTVARSVYIDKNGVSQSGTLVTVRFVIPAPVPRCDISIGAGNLVDTASRGGPVV